ncbi:MAG: GNAT family N-acetyltransferase [Chitinophagaceae bacterium]
MNISIRPATETDFPAVLDLVKGLAIYQGTPERVLNTVEQMKAEQQYFRCLVAENEQKEIIGIASYFFAYYTWVGKSLYLDDLYVKQECRGQKAGSRLLQAVIEIAKKENCKRVRWQVSEWNKPALAFYENIGAEIDREAINCDLDEKHITNKAS